LAVIIQSRRLILSLWLGLFVTYNLDIMLSVLCRHTLNFFHFLLPRLNNASFLWFSEDLSSYTCSSYLPIFNLSIDFYLQRIISNSIASKKKRFFSLPFLYQNKVRFHAIWHKVHVHVLRKFEGCQR
jgi:hypothetical protein